MSFYDYAVCGLSVLAHLVVADDSRAQRLLQIIVKNMEHYCREVHGHEVSGHGVWTVPLGVVRGHGFTAGISALRALNRTWAPGSDYALDQQTMIYLAHRDAGVILTGFKSKRDPAYSTFRIGDDAYTVRTGTLAMGETWAEAVLCYETFTGTLRWDLGAQARLTLRADTDRPVVTTLPATRAASIHSSVPVDAVSLKGFSPYSRGNAAPEVPAVRFRWEKELVVEFDIPAGSGHGMTRDHN